MFKRTIKRASKHSYQQGNILLGRLLFNLARAGNNLESKLYFTMLEHESDSKFSRLAKKDFYKINQNNKVINFVRQQAIKRNDVELINAFEQSILGNISTLYTAISAAIKLRNVSEIDNLLSSLDVKVLQALLDRASLLEQAYINLYLSNSLELKLTQLEVKDVHLFISFANKAKRAISTDLINIIQASSYINDKRINRGICVNLQRFKSVEIATSAWEGYYSLYNDDVGALKNLLSLYSKTNSEKVKTAFESLLALRAVDDKDSHRLIKTLVGLGCTNDVIQYQKHARNLKDCRLIIDFFRRSSDHERMYESMTSYEANYGQDKWFNHLEGKILIDLGEYQQAVKHFNKFKNLTYLAISHIKNKEVKQAVSLFKKMLVNDKQNKTALLFLADINYYENKKWANAVVYYGRLLELEENSLIRLRYLKAKIASGTSLEQYDFKGISREERFYINYLQALEVQNEMQAITQITNVFSDDNLSPVYLDNSSKVFFDRIQSRSKKKHKAQQKVSVIMTTYKSKACVDRAISSILEQSYKNIELIVVDDCSPDDTFAYLQNKYATQITLMQPKKNSGTYVCKNLGMSECSGDYITFMDSDDWSHPDRILHQVNYLNSNTEHIACQTGHLRIFDNGDLLIRKRGINVEAPISLMIKRKIINKLGYFDSVRVSGDSEYINRIKKYYGRDTVAILNAPLYLARQSDSSLTTSGPTALSWAAMPKIRIDYRRMFRNWHKNTENLYVERVQEKRCFEAPLIIQST